MNTFSRLTTCLGIILVFNLPGGAQINNSLYFMHGVPQSNRINPAHQPNSNFYLGFPGLAPLRIDAGSSSIAYGDVIYPHPTQDSLITFLHPLGDKQAFMDLLKPVNSIGSDFGISLVSLGFRTGVGFFTIDLTTRTEGRISYPGDLARLILNGAEEGVTYQLDGIGADFSVYNEASLGWSAAILDNLTLGARAKVLFGAANFSTTSSELAVTTSQDVWNVHSDMRFNASIPFADVLLDGNGMFDSIAIADELQNSNGPSIRDITNYIFNTNNLGLGLDVGVDFRPIDQLLISASVMDLGFINWKDGTEGVSYKTDYDFSGFEINPLEFSDGFTFDSTLSQLGDSLTNFLTFTSGGTYTKRLNTKLFVGASYSLTPKINFGILSRTDFRNGEISQQATASVNLTTGRFANLTLSYSYMNASYKNFGAGFSFNVGPLNMYMISDNIINVTVWPQEARSVNLWFGMNLVFGYKKFMRKEATDRPLVY